MSTNPRSHQRERERERGLGKPGPPPTQRLPSLTSSAQEIETLFANLCPRFPLSPWKPFAGGGGWYILSPPIQTSPPPSHCRSRILSSYLCTPLPASSALGWARVCILLNNPARHRRVPLCWGTETLFSNLENVPAWQLRHHFFLSFWRQIRV